MGGMGEEREKRDSQRETESFADLCKKIKRYECLSSVWCRRAFRVPEEIWR
jgi:hypothetical protein